MLVEAH